MWALFAMLNRQWHSGLNGVTRLDLNVFIPVIQRNNWDLDVALMLLTTIEDEVLKKDG